MPGDDSWESAPFLYHVSPRENHWWSCDRKERDEGVHQEPLPFSPVSYIHGAKASLNGIPLHLLAASSPPPPRLDMEEGGTAFECGGSWSATEQRRGCYGEWMGHHGLRNGGG